MNAFIEFFDEISKFWWAIFGGAISLTAYFVLEKFKNRMSYFESVLNYNSVGTSLSDNLFGDIKVTHNGNEIKHLNFITINIRNSSNTDFEDLHIVCWVDNRSQILAWSGNFDDSKIAIKLDEDHIEKDIDFNLRLNDFLREHGSSDLPHDLASDLYYFSRNRTLVLPVFNRGSSITLNFLVENFDGNLPVIQFPVQHKSVKVIPAENRESKNNKLGIAMLKYGYAILVIGIIWLFLQDSVDQTDLIIFSILSVFYLWLGLLFHYTKNYIQSIFK